MSSDKGRVVSLDFEVYGEVQGVFFRKFTQEAAKDHHCVGWVSNTYHGTVRGVVQGKSSDVNYMKTWLQSTGSPASKIHSVKFTNEKNLGSAEYMDFSIRY